MPAAPNLHFDGPMIAGGLAYDLQEIAAAPVQRTFMTGRMLDAVTGGIRPDAVQAVTGPPGI